MGAVGFVGCLSDCSEQASHMLQAACQVARTAWNSMQGAVCRCCAQAARPGAPVRASDYLTLHGGTPPHPPTHPPTPPTTPNTPCCCPCHHPCRYIADRASRGLRSLGVAQSLDDGATWELVGLLSLLDPPRPDSAETIRLSQTLGVEVGGSG